MRTAPPFRADHVGSFLRPPALLDARERFKQGSITGAELHNIEDTAIADIVRFQEDLGLKGITDGEFRRTYFHIDFLEQLEGVETKGGIQVSFRSAAGNVDFSPPVMHVTGKLRHVKPIQIDDFQFLKSVTKQLPKVTIPSPTMLHFRGGRNAISKEALILRDRGIKTLIVCGVTTEVCVNTSVREANDRGYECVVLSDCVGSYFPEFQKSALAMIKAQGGIFGWVSDSRRALAAIGA